MFKCIPPSHFRHTEIYPVTLISHTCGVLIVSFPLSLSKKPPKQNTFVSRCVMCVFDQFMKATHAISLHYCKKKTKQPQKKKWLAGQALQASAFLPPHTRTRMHTHTRTYTRAYTRSIHPFSRTSTHCRAQACNLIATRVLMSSLWKEEILPPILCISSSRLRE